MSYPAMKVYMSDPRGERCAVWIVKGNVACPVDYFDINSPPLPSFPNAGWKRFAPNPDKYWAVKLVSGQTLVGTNNFEFVRVTGSLS